MDPRTGLESVEQRKISSSYRASKLGSSLIQAVIKSLF
jgi:hypothetical protein